MSRFRRRRTVKTVEGIKLKTKSTAKHMAIALIKARQGGERLMREEGKGERKARDVVDPKAVAQVMIWSASARGMKQSISERNAASDA